MSKNKNLVIWIAVTAVFLIALAWYTKSGSSAPSGTSAASSGAVGELKAAETSYDFGSVSMAAGKVSHTFQLKNESKDPVTITKLYTSCMCTTTSLKNGGSDLGPFGMAGMGYIPSLDEKVNPGGEVEVEATFDPAAHGPAGVGNIERVVTVEQSGSAPIELHFKAVVTP